MGRIDGLCVSGGSATGKICIVDLNYTDKQLKESTVLVMKNLDRELLVNLNKNVVGVIAETGNIGSHGAGILRHLKIPCILRIKNALKIFKDGELVKLCGSDSCIYFGKDAKNMNTKSDKNAQYGTLYSSFSTDAFSLADIKTNNIWQCARPDRPYQRLRYDIIKEVYVESASFLFGLPPAKIKQNTSGAIATFGAPNNLDICKFVLKNPSWLITKAIERNIVVNNIKEELHQLNCLPQTMDAYITIFEKSVELYRSLFRYSLMSQAISDELLDAYLDFISMITDKEISKDILNLKSEYVENCIFSGVDPGVSQKWKSEKAERHIWDGTILFEPLSEDKKITEKIFSMNNSKILKKDYDSFRVIVPLVYQLSEEFFYISSSVNSYINWSLVKICDEINRRLGITITIEELYEFSLENLYNLIKKLQRRTLK